MNKTKYDLDCSKRGTEIGILSLLKEEENFLKFLKMK